MDKVWVVTQESNVDGEIHFHVVVCKDKETALETMEEKKKWLRENHSHFKNYEKDDDLILEETETSFYVEEPYDSYYEDINVFQTNLN